METAVVLIGQQVIKALERSGHAPLTIQLYQGQIRRLDRLAQKTNGIYQGVCKVVKPNQHLKI